MRALTVDQLGFDPRKLGKDSPLLQQRSPRGPKKDGEHQEQVKLFAWAEEQLETMPELRWMFAVPNFSGRLGKVPPVAAVKQAARLKAEGRKKGVLDVWWPLHRSGFRAGVPHVFPGLVIEMKYGDGVMKKEQAEWAEHLQLEGWAVVVCYTFEHARDMVLEYYREEFRA